MENIQSFDGKKVETSTYNQTYRPRFHEDYDLKESDVPAFLFLSSSTRVSIPHLLFRVDTPSWPVIKDFTESLPLQEDKSNEDPSTPTLQEPKEIDSISGSKSIAKPKKR
jgi:hypothetical protein